MNFGEGKLETLMIDLSALIHQVDDGITQSIGGQSGLIEVIYQFLRSLRLERGHLLKGYSSSEIDRQSSLHLEVNSRISSTYRRSPLMQLGEKLGFQLDLLVQGKLDSTAHGSYRLLLAHSSQYPTPIGWTSHTML